MWRRDKGHAAVEYMLVVAILVLGLVAAFYRPAANGENLGKSFVHWTHDLVSRVAKP